MKKWWADFILLVKTFSKYRLRKQFRKPFQLIGISLLLVIVISFVYSPVSNYYRELTHPKAYGRVKVDWYKDYNSEHLKFAKKNGIQPFKNSKALHEGIGKLLKENQLEKVKNTKYYRLKGLTHSHPYLTPIAVQLLEDIGKRFRKKLDKFGIKYKKKMDKYIEINIDYFNIDEYIPDINLVKHEWILSDRDTRKLLIRNNISFKQRKRYIYLE